MFFWTLAIVAFIIVEAVTTQFVCIWFAGGSLVALIASLLGLNIWVQVIAFVISSALLLVCTKEFIKKLKSKTGIKTNSEALIGQSALVTDDIINIEEKGRVKLRGMEWSARSADNSPISSGEYVTVTSIEGVKLIVNKN